MFKKLIRYTVVRHGQTTSNKLGVLQGHLPGELTEEGFHQANLIG